MATLIGLGGKLRSGKDALAEYLRSEHDFIVMGMSDALNEALLKLNPWIEVPGGRENFSALQRYQDLHDAVGYVEAKKNPEVRRLLQVLGTEVGREMINPDVWVSMAEKRILGYLSEGRSVVITAMRFPNELDMLERLGGTSIWIDRPDEARGVHTEVSAHASETSVQASQFEYILRNGGTLEDLYEKGEYVLQQIR